MKKMFTAGTITVFSLGLIVAATAQQQQQQFPQERAQPERSPQERMIEDETEHAQQQEETYHRSEDLIGSRVINAEGDRLGTVHDLAVQLENGRFSYAIVEAGGFLGIGGEWHPVPPGALRVQEAQLGIELVLDISESEWENAPTFEEDQIQQLAQDNRAQEIYEFYGQDWQEQQDTEFAAPERNARNAEEQQQDQQSEQNDWQDQQAEQQEPQQQEQQEPFGARQQPETQEQPQLRMARDVTDMDLVNEQQGEIGQIRGLLVNLEEGHVGFVLFSGGAGLFQVGGEEYAVAPQALRVEDERAILNVTQQQLEQAETLTSAQVAMQAQEQADLDPEEARESPEVFRFQEEDDQNGVFAAPDRDDTETQNDATDETGRQNGSPDLEPQQQQQER